MHPPPDALLRLRVLPRDVASRARFCAHLEAHDHLGIATEMPDGSIEIQGPAAREEELRAVVQSLASLVGALIVA